MEQIQTRATRCPFHRERGTLPSSFVRPRRGAAEEPSMLPRWGSPQVACFLLPGTCPGLQLLEVSWIAASRPFRAPFGGAAHLCEPCGRHRSGSGDPQVVGLSRMGFLSGRPISSSDRCYSTPMAPTPTTEPQEGAARSWSRAGVNKGPRTIHPRT